MLAQLISNKVTIGGKKLSATAETAGASGTATIALSVTEALAEGGQSPNNFDTAAIAASSSTSPTTITQIAGGS